ncbi:MAG: RNA methyltransferase, partial [Candidatus Eisenbacteria sp.]|nr:RNA methyltransferase [Candidatus Eisenbacteria bacterium]
MNPENQSGPCITSLHHPFAVRIRKIVARPQLAKRLGLFLLDGIHLMEEAVDAPYQPEVILASPRLRHNPRGQRLLQRVVARDWNAIETTDALMRRLAPTETPQGILGLFRRPVEPPAAQLPRHAGVPEWGTSQLALLLAGIQDPGNLGALARTAHAFGHRCLITTPATVDPYHVRALRASSGALLHMQVSAGVEEEEIRTWSECEHATLAALTTRVAGSISLEALAQRTRAQQRPLVIVLGSEGRGIPPSVDNLCHERCSI